jgi:hypothetical protein
MLLQVLAAATLVVLLWSLFRLAMSLRWAKLSREAARRDEDARGRRVVAELPVGGSVVLFLEDAEGYAWGAQRLARGEITGARVLLNGGVIGSWVRKGDVLPDPPPAETYEGRERWELELYLTDGRRVSVPCGTLREGVSREAALAAFEAVRRGAEGRSC